MRVTPAGGSSSVLSRAAWASSFMRWAASMMATRAPPSTGSRASSPMRSRMPRARAPGPPMTTWRPGPSGPIRCRSGCPPEATSRQPGTHRTAAQRHPRPCTGARRPGRGQAWSCRSRRDRRATPRGAPLPGSSSRPRRARPAAPGSGRPACGSRSGGLGRAGRGLAGGLPLGRRGRGPGVGRGAASPAAAVGALLVARRFGARRRRRRLGVEPSRPAAAGLRVERRFGAAASTVASAALDAADAVVLRGARRFGAAVSAARLDGVGRRDRLPRVGRTADQSDGADWVGRDGSVAGLTFWPTWARSTASSSGGTSLHGSFDDVGRGAASRGRSSRRP